MREKSVLSDSLAAQSSTPTTTEGRGMGQIAWYKGQTTITTTTTRNDDEKKARKINTSDYPYCPT
jgi:hypothetical protein